MTKNKKQHEEQKEKSTNPIEGATENESIAEQEVQEEKSETKKREEEIERLKDALLRQAAEYDNYRKRTAKERLEMEPEIILKTMTKLLPVLDNLERALSAECTDPNYKKGVEMIHESFLTTLSELGVEEIKTDGEDFNPIVHQAVQQVESKELTSGKIAATFQKGYKIGDKVIRFSMVSVVS